MLRALHGGQKKVKRKILCKKGKELAFDKHNCTNPDLGEKITHFKQKRAVVIAVSVRKCSEIAVQCLSGLPVFRSLLLSSCPGKSKTAAEKLFTSLYKQV